MNTTDLSALNGKIVLVQSASDRRNPPAGMRGTLRVIDDPRTHRPIVQVELDFPQMFTRRAHHRTITLNGPEVSELLASDQDGTYRVTLEDSIDPDVPAGGQ